MTRFFGSDLLEPVDNAPPLSHRSVNALDAPFVTGDIYERISPMTRQDLIKRMGAVARLYGRTHDPQVRHELTRLGLTLIELDNVEVPGNAVASFTNEDIHTRKINAALTFFKHGTLYKSPARQSGEKAITRDELEKLICEAALRFQKRHEPQAQEEVARLAYKLAQLRYLETLEDALQRCRTTDVRTKQVYHALGFLQYRSGQNLPFEQFRRALDKENDESRWQLLNDSLNQIRKAVEESLA
jgi:hypothetical protein